LWIERGLLIVDQLSIAECANQQSALDQQSTIANQQSIKNPQSQSEIHNPSIRNPHSAIRNQRPPAA
jgi:hypothetical protein